MPLNLYDTATRRTRLFTPIVEGKVGIYLCGATVQAPPHVGHVRSSVSFDVLRRWLMAAGYEVTLIRNVTDIDDKIIHNAGHEDVPYWVVAMRNERHFTTAYDVLGCLPPTYEPRATGHIPEMITMMQRIIDAGYGYAVNGDVYFDVRAFPGYGELSGQKIDDMLAASDSAAMIKRDPRDFAMWKAAKADEPAWDTPWGPGRPGWHIECSAMAHKYLGPSFDIHGGGLDLVFPHHENEIAQSCCAFGHDVMAKVWMHNGFLQVEGQKMSKSLGNFVTINELLASHKFGGRSWPGEVLRLAMLKTHYRQPIDFTVKALEEAEKTLANWAELAGRHHVSLTSGPVEPALRDALCDDLNTASAFAVLSDLARKAKVNSHDAQQLVYCAEFLGLNTKHWFSNSDVTEAMADRDPAWVNTITSLIEARIEARRTKNFAESDRIRDELVAMGIQLKDGKDAEGNPTTTWEVMR